MKVHNMVLRIPFIVGWMIWIVASDNVFASDDGVLNSTVGPRLMQDHAGTKVGSGWYLALSLTERFQVLLPRPFNEWSLSSEQVPGPINFLGTKTQDQVNFMVIEFPRSLYPPQADLRQIVDVFYAERKRKMTRYSKFRGFATIEVEIVGEKRSRTTRFVMTEGHLYQLSIDFPNDLRLSSNRFKKRFFRSFRAP